jgi:hypothetical protein
LFQLTLPPPLFLIPLLLLLLLLEELTQETSTFLPLSERMGKKKFISFDFCVIRGCERAENEGSWRVAISFLKLPYNSLSFF